MTISTLKKQVERATNIDIDRQQMLYQGKSLAVSIFVDV